MAPPTATETVPSNVTIQSRESSQAAGAEKAKVKMAMPKQPVFENKMEEREYLKGRLAAAFRILGKYGYDEGMTMVPGLCSAIDNDRCGRPYHAARPRRAGHFLGQSIRRGILANQGV